MKIASSFKYLVGASLLAGSMAAQALPLVNATFAFGLNFGSDGTSGRGYDGANLHDATAIYFGNANTGSLTQGDFSVSGVGSTFNALPNDMHDPLSNPSSGACAGACTQVPGYVYFNNLGLIGIGATNALNLTSPIIAGGTTFMQWKDPTNAWTFDAQTLAKLPSSTNTLDILITGMWIDGTGTYQNSLSSVHITLNQTAGNGSVSGSGVWANPPEQITVPEPVSLSLFGIGLAGIAASRRKLVKSAA